MSRKILVEITREENAEYFGVRVGDTVPVDFDIYVSAVVASEIGNADIEACKAQAVAARTFAVLKGVLDGKTISDSSATDQAFRIKRYDTTTYPNAIAGEDMTANEILTYNGKPISAVYSACNGGKTASAKERWGSARAYLIEQVDPWDNSTKRTGHGVGMSQRGAKAMAKSGKLYSEILEFYYPGTELVKLEEDMAMVKMLRIVNAKDFIEKVMIPLQEGWGYIYGTWGQMWTQEAQAKLNQTTDPYRAKSRQFGSKWVGKNVTDCSGLIRRAMYWLGVEVAHHATYLYTDYCEAKGRYTGAEILKPGTLVFKKGSREKIHHVGVYLGGSTVEEAKGAEYGVVTSTLSDGWDYWGELKMVDYTNSTKEEAVHMMTAAVSNTISGTLNMRTGPGKAYPILCKIPRGDIVEVVDATNSKWYQVRYGGRIGWVSTDYLTLNDSVTEVPEVETVVGTPSVPSLDSLCSGIRATMQQLNEQVAKLEAVIALLK